MPNSSVRLFNEYGIKPYGPIAAKVIARNAKFSGLCSECGRQEATRSGSVRTNHVSGMNLLHAHIITDQLFGGCVATGMVAVSLGRNSGSDQTITMRVIQHHGVSACSSWPEVLR